MDLKINEKEVVIKEWLDICLDTCEGYSYVLEEDLRKILTDYSDLVYEKIIKSNKISRVIENALDDDIDRVILDEETMIESNSILVDILLDEFDYTYPAHKDILVKNIYTAQDYYSYLLNLTLDGSIGYHVEEINDGRLELLMDFYDCGEYYPVLIASNNNFNNVVQLFSEQDENKPANENNNWGNYSNIKLQMKNGQTLETNKRLERMVSKILMHYNKNKNN